MNRQTLIAILLAACAGLLAYYYLSEREAAVRAEVTPVKVLLAKKPISRGSALTPDKVAIEEIPGAYVQPGALSATSSKGVVKQWEQIKGQFAVVPIAQGEQILPNKLSKILPGFAGVVPEGMRIVSFSLDPAAAVGGHVKPGNRVDILGTFDHQYKGAKRVTTVILAQNILITAVGGQTTADRAQGAGAAPAETGAGTVICLALTPEDAVRLVLAEKEGNLKLALRSVGDDNLLELPDQNLGTVLGPLMRAGQDEIKSAPRKIEIIKGMQ